MDTDISQSTGSPSPSRRWAPRPWPALAALAALVALVESNNGVFAGCWCMGFQPEGVTGVAAAFLTGALSTYERLASPSA